MKIGFVTGCFDITHSGHVYFLNKCKEFCDFLVVSVARDEIMTKSKRYPIMNQKQRIYMLNNLRNVDLVVSEDNKTPPHNIKRLLKVWKPDVFLVTPDNSNYKIYKKLCKKMGVVLIELKRNNKGIFNISTTKIIQKILQTSLY